MLGTDYAARTRHRPLVDRRVRLPVRQSAKQPTGRAGWNGRRRRRHGEKPEGEACSPCCGAQLCALISAQGGRAGATRAVEIILTVIFVAELLCRLTVGTLDPWNLLLIDVMFWVDVISILPFFAVAVIGDALSRIS